MIKVKEAKRFLVRVVILLITIPILYSIIYSVVGRQDIEISHSYKQFILQHTKGHRIIIDSGSNSKYAIDGKILEKEFNIQSINISDNAGFPLKQKLLRIKKYSNANDIVILPLEWQYYSREEVGMEFKKRLLGNLNYYYNFNSAIEELNQIFNTPFIDYVNNIKVKYNLYRKQSMYLERNIIKFNENDRGTLTNNNKFNIDMSCDKYILSQQLKNGFYLSDVFKKNIQIIKQLQKRNIHVVFTWPTVVGDNCYSEAYKLTFEKLVVEIKNYLEANKIPIIGNIYDNKFLSKDRRDTYYHVNNNAKEIRTKQLINSIKQHSINKYFKESKIEYQKNIRLSKSNMLNLLDKTCSPKERISFNSIKALFIGWSHPEKNFRWSLNGDAKIYFKTNPDNLIGKLKLNINTLGKQEITVKINQHELGKKIVNGKNKTINFSFDPTILNKDKINTIKFEFSNAHMPNNKDKRALAIALKSFILE